jgi:hypothetical protein
MKSGAWKLVIKNPTQCEYRHTYSSLYRVWLSTNGYLISPLGNYIPPQSFLEACLYSHGQPLHTPCTSLIMLVEILIRKSLSNLCGFAVIKSVNSTARRRSMFFIYTVVTHNADSFACLKEGESLTNLFIESSLSDHWLIKMWSGCGRLFWPFPRFPVSPRPELESQYLVRGRGVSWQGREQYLVLCQVHQPRSWIVLVVDISSRSCPSVIPLGRLITLWWVLTVKPGIIISPFVVHVNSLGP